MSPTANPIVPIPPDQELSMVVVRQFEPATDLQLRLTRIFSRWLKDLSADQDQTGGANDEASRRNHSGLNR